MIEETIKSIADIGNDLVWNYPASCPWLVVILLSCGIFVTFRMGWINIRKLGHSLSVIRGNYDNPKDSGDINHFQALTTALSATVGIGNIAGVATAIHYGGPGVLFWLWLSGIFGMTLKFAECTLALHYRTFDENGNASGGPMYYIEKGLGPNWKWLAVIFALLAIICSFATGNMNQANSVAVSCASDFDIEGIYVGIALALVAGAVIIGGIKRIGAVTSKLMPSMACFYIIGTLVILFADLPGLPGLFATIIEDAFAPKAAFGGAAVGAWNLTMLWGIKRALFSNEAGQGSAPIAHAAAKTKEPVREGLVAMVGPLVDTITICTLTGLVIISQGTWNTKHLDTRPLELNKIKVTAIQEPRLTDQDTHGENCHEIDDILFTGKTTVTDGKATGIRFYANDAFIQDPVLLVRPGGTTEYSKYSGPFMIKDDQLYGKEEMPLSLILQGKLLLHSSALTARSFEIGFEKILGMGDLGSLMVTIAVILFALSTIISWSYYGDRCVEYLFGARYVVLYRLVYVCFTCLGACLALETVWAFGDLALGLMSLPNLLAVLLLSPVLVKITKEYFSRKHVTYKDQQENSSND